MEKMRAFIALASGALASLALASVALAQPPTGQVYGGVAGDLEGQVGVAGETAVVSTLPFTGLDLAFALAAGLGLLAVGMMTRRFARVRR